MESYDFKGWATKNDLQCSDGRIIRKDAFKHNDGQTVPLVWNHDHTDPYRIVGHALLENREEGVYAYGKFNDTDLGQTAKTYVQHGDITQLSIYANQLKQQGPNVLHGAIREVSLVLAGANPGAYIESVMVHGEESDEEAVIFTGEDITLIHAESGKKEDEEEDKETKKDDDSESKDDTSEKDKESKKKKTVKEVFNELTDDQKTVVYAMLGYVAQHSGMDEDDIEHSDIDESDENDDDTQSDENNNDNSQSDEGGNDNMKHNVFDQNDNNQENELMHSEIMSSAIADAKRYGSLKESVMQHAAANNITDINELLPKEKDLNLPPEWIKKDDSWVSKVMDAVHHTPFSRVRALFAKMDEKEARARGYIKGNEKLDLKLAVLKRTTAPTTVYIKMKMDRDDIVDINFDALAWIRAEMRKNLDRELARGFLLGDKRDPSSDDKIDELCIRPVLTDDEMYTIQYTVTDGTDHHSDFNSHSENDSEAKGVVRAAIKSRKGYKGSGTPTFFTTEDLLTELLLIEDQNGRRIYESITALATAMRVKEIVTVPEMEEHTDIYGIIVNMNDYNTGADKGGEVNMFDDFDIDYNQQKYLMETRCSGALVKPKSAIVLKKASAAG